MERVNAVVRAAVYLAASTPMKKPAYPPEAAKGRSYSLTPQSEDVEEDRGCLYNVWSFAVSFGIAALFTTTLTVYITSQVTTLQKQYDWSSTMVGGLLSCNDIGFLSAVLLVSHLGHTCHIPRLLGLATLLFGVSGLLSAMTYFLQPASLQLLDANASLPSPSLTGRLCLQGQGTGKGSCGEGEAETGGNTLVLVLLGLSMVLQGVAKAPRVSLSTTYVDDSTPDKARTSLYLGFIMTLTIFGPPVAIFVGGLFQRLPVDLKETMLTPTHPAWIGCWWLGFLVFGVAAILASFPLFLFPRSMRATPSRPDNFTPMNFDLEPSKVKSEATFADGKEGQMKKGEEKTNATKAPKKLLGKILKGLPVSLFRILRQPVYTLTLLGIVAIQFGVSGDISFGPKYVEHQFQLPAFKTNLIMGTQKIIGATVGTFLGGLVTSRMRLGRVGCLRFLLGAVTLAMIFKGLGLVFGCPNPAIVGIDSQGQVVVPKSLEAYGCNCTGVPYFPVCADNRDNYFSPCSAACTNVTRSGYSGCRLAGSANVTAGLCESDCPWLYYYMATDLASGLVGTLGIMPAFITLIRSVKEEDRSIAMGLFTFLSSLLGFLPAPIIFGGVIDSTCLVWKESCGKRGLCALYDIALQRLHFKGVIVGVFGVSLLAFLMALLVAMRQDRGVKVDVYRVKDGNANGDAKAEEEKVTKL